MNVIDIYVELNLFNWELMANTGIKLPDNFMHRDLAMPSYPLDGEHRFVLAGINDMGQVFVTGFSLINKMRRVRKQYMSEAGCKYFIVCKNIGGSNVQA